MKKGTTNKGSSAKNSAQKVIDPTTGFVKNGLAVIIKSLPVGGI